MSSFKNLAVGLGLGIVALVGTGCGDNQEPEAADSFWTRIQASNYQSWSRAPGYATRLPSSAPHGESVEIYVNPVIQAAITDATPLTEWPLDSWVIKNGFDSDDALFLVASMEKRADGWFWAEYDEEGSASYSGKPDLCIDCHSAGTDFTQAFTLPQ
jgi:hypothetical protein